MAKEFTVRVEHRPGQLAQLGQVLGDAGITVEAILATTCEGEGIIHFVADDPEKTTKVLEESELSYTSREVLIVNVLGEPGGLGDVALVMAHAGINIEAVYARRDGRLIMGVDDLSGAVQVAQGMAVL